MVVEVNSETDFVARNEDFQKFASTVAETALAAKGDHEALLKATYPGAGKPVADKLTDMIATIGENLTLRRSAGLTVGNGVVASYVHAATVPGSLGRIGVLVALESTADKAKLEELGKQLAMHVAATNPQSVDVASLDPAAVERERDVLSEQAKGSGKPPEIVAKMVEGRLRKFYEEVVLSEQVFVIDGESRVGKVVEAAAKDGRRARSRSPVSSASVWAKASSASRPTSPRRSPLSSASERPGDRRRGNQQPWPVTHPIAGSC